jgi:hypothetical protein
MKGEGTNSGVNVPKGLNVGIFRHFCLLIGRNTTLPDCEATAEEKYKAQLQPNPCPLIRTKPFSIFYVSEFQNP